MVGDVPPAARNSYPCSGLNFPKNRYTYLGIFKKKVPIPFDFATKTHYILVRDFFMKNGTHVLGFLAKNQPILVAHSLCLNIWVPPPPGPFYSWLQIHNRAYLAYKIWKLINHRSFFKQHILLCCFEDKSLHDKELWMNNKINKSIIFFPIYQTGLMKISWSKIYKILSFLTRNRFFFNHYWQSINWRHFGKVYVAKTIV